MARIRDLGALFSNRKVLFAMNCALGAMVVIFSLFLIRDVLSLAVSFRRDATRSEKKEFARSATRPGLQSYGVILRKNPFGFAAGELHELSPSSTTGGAPSDSELMLIGTVSGKKEVSYAIFSDRTGQQEVFRVGQDVFGAGKLRSVEKNSVVIGSTRKDVRIQLTDLAKVREIKAPQPNSAGPLGRKMGESSYLLDQQRIQQALEKPDQIMTDARFVPNLAEGRQQGFVLRELKPGGIYQSLGLQNGDVLLRINEFTINNPETALQAITALKGTDRAQLDIIRSGSRMTMTYQIR